MPDRSQRRDRRGDESRRSHRLQHRDRNEGWAERGTWTHLHGDNGGGQRSGAYGSPVETDDSPVRQVSEGARHETGWTQRSDAAQGMGSEQRGDAQRRGAPDRAPGDEGSPSTYQPQGNPRTGSQRGTGSEQGIGDEAGGQFGDLHGSRPSPSQAAGYHEEDWVGGRGGRPARDYQFGSRRGHGTRRREDPRTE